VNDPAAWAGLAVIAGLILLAWLLERLPILPARRRTGDAVVEISETIANGDLSRTITVRARNIAEAVDAFDAAWDAMNGEEYDDERPDLRVVPIGNRPQPTQAPPRDNRCLCNTASICPLHNLAAHRHQGAGTTREPL
jgi:hypothetical protein